MVRQRANPREHELARPRDRYQAMAIAQRATNSFLDT